MEKNNLFEDLCDQDYGGQILYGHYSQSLKKRVADCIRYYRAFEQTGNPAIPYRAYAQT